MEDDLTFCWKKLEWRPQKNGRRPQQKIEKNGRRPQTKNGRWPQKMEDNLKKNEKQPQKKYNGRRLQAPLKKSTFFGCDIIVYFAPGILPQMKIAKQLFWSEGILISKFEPKYKQFSKKGKKEEIGWTGVFTEVQTVVKTPRSAKLTYIIFLCHLHHMT